ncbi:MAG TPA: phosphatase PAP2 family protein [Candidatus Wirthbacteria bacterium]|nr:phosphatase PAP2 family protein [Candidatus Wirthbacteria bacterium]
MYTWLGPLILLKNHHSLLKPLALSMLTVGLVTAFINITFQTTAPRAELLGMDVFSRLLRWHYSLNRPLTSFPSLHVSHSICLTYYLNKAFPKYKFWFNLSAFLVSLSTLLVKQHYIPDVIAGTLLAIVCCRYFEIILTQKTLSAPQPIQTQGESL